MAPSETSFGYLLPTRELVMAKSPPDAGLAIELAETAEELGFGSDADHAGPGALALPKLRRAQRTCLWPAIGNGRRGHFRIGAGRRDRRQTHRFQDHLAINLQRSPRACF